MEIKEDVKPPLATATDNMSDPTAPQELSYVFGYDEAGGNWDKARLAKLHDLDSGAGQEFNTGVSDRIPASGGSVAITGRTLGSTVAKDVAIVDGSGNQITSFGGGTQYTEDVAAAADPTGTTPILVRKDTPAAITSTDGDNIAQRATNYGAAYVQVVTSTGSFVDSFGGGGGGGTQYADGAARGTATGTLMMVDDGTNMQSAAGTTAGLLKVDLSGTAANGTAIKVDGSAVTQPISGSVTVTQATGTNLHTVVDSGTITTVSTVTNVQQQGGVNISLNTGVRDAGTQRVTIATNDTVVVDSELPAAAALADATANPTTPLVGSANELYNGTTWDRARGIANGTNSTGTGIAAAGLLAQLNDVSVGTVSENNFGNLRINSNRALHVQLRGSTDVVLGDATTPIAVAGNVASAATDSGNPVKIGFIGKTTSLITAVTDGQRVNGTADKFGRQLVLPHLQRDLITTQTTTISASTSETTILTSVASTFLDIRHLVVSNTSNTATRVDFRDATAGSVKFSWQVPAGMIVGFAYPVPVPQTTAANNWTAQSSASVTDLRVYVVAEKMT